MRCSTVSVHAQLQVEVLHVVETFEDDAEHVDG